MPWKKPATVTAWPSISTRSPGSAAAKVGRSFQLSRIRPGARSALAVVPGASVRGSPA